MTEQQARLLQNVEAARDRVDLLQALLAACRSGADYLTLALGSREKRVQIAAETRRARPHFSTTLVDRAARKYAREKLSNDDYVLNARALALAIDQVIQSQDARKYRTMCARFGIRELKDLDPYPTPTFPLAATFGDGGFSPAPRNSGSVWATDRVTGLALWNGSSHGALRVVYDPVAGSALDDALDEKLDLLTVTPNQSLTTEFSDGDRTSDGFFGIRPVDPAEHIEILRDSFAFCVSHEIDILVLPELAGTDDLQSMIADSPNGFPALIIAGSCHIRDASYQVNRQTVLYVRNGHMVHHDKSATFYAGAPVIDAQDGVQEPNIAVAEDIDYGAMIRLHAGINWSMVSLICADFLDDLVVQSVADLHPRLVVVAAMSAKMSPFERSAGTVIAVSQATVVVANGAVDFRAPEQVNSSPLVDGDCATIAIFSLPLDDPAAATIRVRPPASLTAPHRVHFESRNRSALLIT